MAGCKRLHLLALSLSAVHCVSQAAAGIASVTKATGISEVQYATLAQNFNQTSLNTSSTASTGSITSDSSSSGSSTSGTSSSAVPTYSNAVLTRPVQFSSSVILFDIGDISSTVRQNGRAANWCALIANNIKQFGSDKINIVLTQYWMPVDAYHPFDIKYYCYKERGGGPCLRFTQAAIDKFEQQMTDCLSVAISQGFKTIMVTAHVDNAVNAYQWRNYVKLSPDQMFDGWSYNDIQLKPLAKAINNNLGKGALLLLNMGGEMGTSYFGWAGKWLKLVKETRDLALSNGKDKYSKELQIGLKTNFERVTGYASQLPGGPKKALARQLFDACEFIAISAYAPMPAKPDASHFTDSAVIADAELRQLGITLQGKDLWYGEFGLGGGTSQYCDKLAKTPAEAGNTPQYGTCWQFNPTLNPWKSKAVLQYMQAYYAAALQWLKSGATDGKWKVKGVFAWNLVSWDIQGVHPLSYAGDGGTFKDATVSQWITEYNKAAASQ